MKASTDKILTAATNCFFQHGYASANISMISRVSGVSRVTIHKHFSSKEQLFYQVVKAYIEQNSHHLENYINSQGDFWSLTQAFIQNNCQEVFSDITSAQIRADLIQAVYQHCRELVDKKRTDICSAICEKLTVAVNKKKLCLNKVGLTPSEFAENIEAIFFSIASTNMDNNVPQLIEQTMKIYQTATQVAHD